MYHLLMDRENGIDRRHHHRRPPHKFNLELIKCIPPNLTVANVENPPQFIKGFSPDGKYLICFSNDKQWVEGYKFLGTANAADLMYVWKTEYVDKNAERGFGKRIRQHIFNRLFRKKWSIHLTHVMKLHREFSLFSGDGKFLIVVTYARHVEQEYGTWHYRLDDELGIQIEHNLQSYRFYAVRIEDGVICDTIEYSEDFINLSHNDGVCIHGNMIGFVSLVHQWVSIVRLDNGEFIKLFTIARHFHGSPHCLCSTVPEYTDVCVALSIQSDILKQKILIRMYRNILNTEHENCRSQLLKTFYKKQKVYHAMEIYKAQFIDTDHMLIRYDDNKQLCYRLDEKKLNRFYVIYSISRNEVLSVFHERDTVLLRLQTNFFDDFHGEYSRFTGRAPSSMSNNIYLRNSQRRLIESYANGEDEAAYNLLIGLPMSSQNFVVSPYLDLSLFRYDVRLISNTVDGTYYSGGPIRFTDPDTGLTRFRIQFAMRRSRPVRNTVKYFFHPYEPLIISVQSFGREYLTNIHIRNPATNVSF